MTGIEYDFDARKYDPEQGSPAHPVGKHVARITATAINKVKDTDIPMFTVEFTTALGKAKMNYNLWHTNEVTSRIAHNQLSALCYSVGVFNPDLRNEGRALIGTQCQILVEKQKDSEYTQIKKVFDVNGNEPSKAGAGAPPPQPQQGYAPQPQQQPQAQPGWGGQPQGAGPVAPTSATPMTNPTQQWQAPAPVQHGPPQQAWAGQPAQAAAPAPEQPQPQWQAQPAAQAPVIDPAGAVAAPAPAAPTAPWGPPQL